MNGAPCKPNRAHPFPALSHLWWKGGGKNSICICADHKQTSVRSNEAFRAWRKVRVKGEGEIEEGLKEVQNGALAVPIHKLRAFMRVSVLLSDWRCGETSQCEGGGQHTFHRYMQCDYKLTNTFSDGRGHSEITFPMKPWVAMILESFLWQTKFLQREANKSPSDNLKFFKRSLNVQKWLWMYKI